MCISFGANAFKAIQLWGLAGGYESIVDKGKSTIYRYLFDAVTSSDLLDTLPPRDITVYERNSEVKEFELPFALKPLNVSANRYNHRDDLEVRTWVIQSIQNIFQRL